MAELTAQQLLGLGQVVDTDAIDRTTGASAKARAATGAAHRQRDKLATLRKFYPDAQPWGTTGQFIFTNPATGRLTLYNETNPEVMGIKIPTLGDVVSAGPEISEGIGATAGGIIGSRAGPGTGMLGAGLGGAGGAAAYDAFANLGLGTVDTRDLVEHGSDLAMSGALNAAGEGAGQAIGKGIQWMVGAAPRMAERLAAAQRMGVDLTPGALSENRLVQSTEAMMAQNPVTAGPVSGTQQRAIQQTAQAVEDTAATAANRAVGLGEAEGGQVAQRAAQAASERFNTIREGLDNRLVAAVGAERQVPLTNVGQTWRQLTAQLERAPDIFGRTVGEARDRLAGAIRTAARNLGHDADAIAGDPAQWAPEVLADTLERGTIPFDVLRSARTSLGKALARPDASGMLPEGSAAVQRAYDALRADIRAAVADAGPAAQRALERHDRYVQAYRGGNNPILDRLTELTGDQTGQAAFDRLWSLAQNDAEGFARIVNRMRAGERDQLASAMIRKLGQATAGAQNAAGDAFSPATYLTNWNKMRPEVKTKLFGEGRNAELGRAMDDLARIMEGMKNAGTFRNTSNTAAHLQTAGLGGAAATAGMAALQGNITPALWMAGGLAAGRGSAELWASPRFVRWFGQTMLGLNRTTSPQGFLKNAAARLLLIGKVEPELNNALEVYRGQLTGQGLLPPDEKKKAPK